MMIATYV